MSNICFVGFISDIAAGAVGKINMKKIAAAAATTTTKKAWGEKSVIFHDITPIILH
jgi:hypothetical protein